MSNLKDYVNKYSYNINFDAEDNIYIARCVELTSISAHGKSQEDAIKEIKVAVLNILECLKKDGEKIPEPQSSQMHLNFKEKDDVKTSHISELEIPDVSEINLEGFKEGESDKKQDN